MLTFKKAVDLTSAEDEAALKAGEEKIDRELAKYDHGAKIVVDLPGARRKVIDRLCTMYREGGWSVRVLDGDQRDPGPMIEFSAPTPRDIPER